MTITSPPRRRKMHQRGHQTRWFAGRITPDDEHQVRMFQVFQAERGVPVPSVLFNATPLAWWQ